jgi:hypothetical protein
MISCPQIEISSSKAFRECAFKIGILFFDCAHGLVDEPAHVGAFRLFEQFIKLCVFGEYKCATL